MCPTSRGTRGARRRSSTGSPARRSRTCAGGRSCTRARRSVTGRVAPAAVADDLGRHALPDRALGGRVREQREVAVAVRVDEAGADDLAGRVDHARPPSPPRRARPTSTMRPSSIATSPRNGGLPVPSATQPSADQDVEHRRSTSCRAPPTCGPRRGSRMSRSPSPRKLKPSTTIMIASAREDRQPRVDVEVRSRAAQHAAPRRLGRLRAEPEEAERRLGEDRDRQVDGDEHDQRRGDVRDHVPRT